MTHGHRAGCNVQAQMYSLGDKIRFARPQEGSSCEDSTDEIAYSRGQRKRESLTLLFRHADHLHHNPGLGSGGLRDLVARHIFQR